MDDSGREDEEQGRMDGRRTGDRDWMDDSGDDAALESVRIDKTGHVAAGDDGRADDAALESVRIDKWLWAARFFKTRSLAAQAVSGGLVRVAEQRVKASRRLRRGEMVHVRRGAQAWDVVVRGLREQRRPAPEARALYEETPESVERRTSEAARREQARMRRARAQGRPTKRERRELERWRERRSGDLDGAPGGEGRSPHR